MKFFFEHASIIIVRMNGVNKAFVLTMEDI
jgi:hypothetical protein